MKRLVGAGLAAVALMMTAAPSSAHLLVSGCDGGGSGVGSLQDSCPFLLAGPNLHIVAQAMPGYATDSSDVSVEIKDPYGNALFACRASGKATVSCDASTTVGDALPSLGALPAGVPLTCFVTTNSYYGPYGASDFHAYTFECDSSAP